MRGGTGSARASRASLKQKTLISDPRGFHGVNRWLIGSRTIAILWRADLLRCVIWTGKLRNSTVSHGPMGRSRDDLDLPNAFGASKLCGAAQSIFQSYVGAECTDPVRGRSGALRDLTVCSIVTHLYDDLPGAPGRRFYVRRRKVAACPSSVNQNRQR